MKRHIVTRPEFQKFKEIIAQVDTNETPSVLGHINAPYLKAAAAKMALSGVHLMWDKEYIVRLRGMLDGAPRI